MHSAAPYAAWEHMRAVGTHCGADSDSDTSESPGLQRHAIGGTAPLRTARFNHFRSYRRTASLSVMTMGRMELLERQRRYRRGRNLRPGTPLAVYYRPVVDSD